MTTRGQLDPRADFRAAVGGQRFRTVLADPPWQFINRTGKVAPEHRRLNRYGTMTTEEICGLPVARAMQEPAHLYLWVPNALLPEGLRVLQAWGFEYKSNIVWHKLRKDGGSDGRGVGFYFRNVTEVLLFGVRGKNARTLKLGRTQVNYIGTRKREHSRKPDEQYPLIEGCSPGPYLELFARGARPGWTGWGMQADDYEPTWKTYPHNSAAQPPRRPYPSRCIGGYCPGSGSALPAGEMPTGDQQGSSGGAGRPEDNGEDNRGYRDAEAG